MQQRAAKGIILFLHAIKNKYSKLHKSVNFNILHEDMNSQLQEKSQNHDY